jgi:hypothetical protein
MMTVENGTVVGIAGAPIFVNVGSQALEIVAGVYTWTLPSGEYAMYSLSSQSSFWKCSTNPTVATSTATVTRTPTTTPTFDPLETTTATATIGATVTPTPIAGSVAPISCGLEVDYLAAYGGSNDVMALRGRKCDFGCPIDVNGAGIKAKLCIVYNQVYDPIIAMVPIPLGIMFVGLIVLVIVYIIRKR